jgi:hypothetical protein
LNNVYPESLRVYLETNLNREYELRYFVLDPAKFNEQLDAVEGYVPSLLGEDQGRGGKDILAGLIKVDFLAAQRRLDDRNSGNRAEDLSRRLSRYYKRSLEKSQGDYAALRALSDAAVSLNNHLQRVFRSTFDRLEQLGYPGLTNPHLIIKTSLNPEAVMNNGEGARVHYALDLPEDGQMPLTLPDQYNGLGYKNLIYMAVELLDLHQQWRELEINRPSLKGAEFARVLVLLDDEEASYNLFSIGKYFGFVPLSDKDQENIAAGEDSVVGRTRRLFYVCCSRAEKDLAVILFAQDVTAARAAVLAKGFFSPENILGLADLPA